MMKYCPECGTKMVAYFLHGQERRCCSSCEVVDWGNQMSVAVAVVAYNTHSEFAMVRMKDGPTGSLTFPQGYREVGETLPAAAAREALEETGHPVTNLQLYDIYTSDEKRLVWVIYKASLGDGEFVENPETSELLFFSEDNPPPFDNLRGPLTKRLLHDILGYR